MPSADKAATERGNVEKGTAPGLPPPPAVEVRKVEVRSRDAADTTVIRDLELRDWAQKLGASRKELADAVGVVGYNAEAVRAHLQHRSDPADHSRVPDP